MGFKENLRLFREAKGITAKDFATMVGLNYGTYISYESAGKEPKFDTLCKIAAALHVSIDDLLGYQKDEFETAKTQLEKAGYTLIPLENYPAFMFQLSNKAGYAVPVIDKRDLMQLARRANSQADLLKYSVLPTYLEKEFYALLARRCCDLDTPPQIIPDDIKKPPANE